MSKLPAVLSQGRPVPLTLSQILASYERVVLIKALQLNGGSRTRAAASLGIPRRHFYDRVKILGIDLSVVPPTMGRPRKEETL